MLIENQVAFKKDDVITLKITSGEEILAKVVEIKDDCIVVKNPVVLVMTQMQGGQGMVAMAPFMLGVEENQSIALYKNQIIVTAKARKDAVAQYIKTTTGLDVPVTSVGAKTKGAIIS